MDVLIYNKLKCGCKLESEEFEYLLKLGTPSSYSNLGYCYYFFEKNNEKAMEWFQKSAELGHSIAMYNLGVLYHDKKDYENAIYWYEKSAELGDNNAIGDLSEMYSINKISDEIYETIYNKFKSKYILPDGVREPEPKKKLKNVYNSLDDDCPICYDKLIGTNSMIVVLICGHIYHKNCIKNQLKCPYCKETIIE